MSLVNEILQREANRIYQKSEDKVKSATAPGYDPNPPVYDMSQIDTPFVQKKGVGRSFIEGTGNVPGLDILLRDINTRSDDPKSMMMYKGGVDARNPWGEVPGEMLSNLYPMMKGMQIARNAVNAGKKVYSPIRNLVAETAADMGYGVTQDLSRSVAMDDDYDVGQSLGINALASIGMAGMFETPRISKEFSKVKARRQKQSDNIASFSNLRKSNQTLTTKGNTDIVENKDGSIVIDDLFEVKSPTKHKDGTYSFNYEDIKNQGNDLDYFYREKAIEHGLDEDDLDLALSGTFKKFDKSKVKKPKKFKRKDVRFMDDEYKFDADKSAAEEDSVFQLSDKDEEALSNIQKAYDNSDKDIPGTYRDIIKDKEVLKTITEELGNVYRPGKNLMNDITEALTVSRRKANEISPVKAHNISLSKTKKDLSAFDDDRLIRSTITDTQLSKADIDEIKRQVKHRIDTMDQETVDAKIDLSKGNRKQVTQKLYQDLVREEVEALNTSKFAKDETKKTLEEELEELSQRKLDTKNSTMSSKTKGNIEDTFKKINNELDNNDMINIPGERRIKNTSDLPRFIDNANERIKELDANIAKAKEAKREAEKDPTSKSIDTIDSNMKRFTKERKHLKDLVKEADQAGKKMSGFAKNEMAKNPAPKKPGDRTDFISDKAEKLKNREEEVLSNYKRLSGKADAQYKDIPGNTHNAKVKYTKDEMKRHNITYTRSTKELRRTISDVEAYDKAMRNNPNLKAFTKNDFDNAKDMYNLTNKYHKADTRAMQLFNRLNNFDDETLILRKDSPITKALMKYGREFEDTFVKFDLNDNYGVTPKKLSEDVDRTGDKTVGLSGEAISGTAFINKENLHTSIGRVFAGKGIYINFKTPELLKKAMLARKGDYKAIYEMIKIDDAKLNQLANEYNINGVDDEVKKAMFKQYMADEIIKSLKNGNNDVFKLFASEAKRSLKDIRDEKALNEVLDLVDAAEVASLNSNIDVGQSNMFIMSKEAQKYSVDNRGQKSLSSVFDNNTGKSTIDDMKRQRGDKPFRGFVTNDGSIYLNNNGEINQKNMLTLYHELAHQFKEANGLYGSSKNHANVDDLAKNVYNKTLNYVNKLTKNDMKPVKESSALESTMKKQEALEFEAYVANTLNDHNSGVAKYLGSGKVQSYKVDGVDTVQAIKNGVGKQADFMRSVTDFVDDMISDSPTLYSALARTDKRLASRGASQKLAGQRKLMEEKLAEIGRYFDKETGNIHKTDLDILGKFVDAGGHLFMKNPELLESFFNRTNKHDFLQYAQKRFSDKLSKDIADQVLESVDFNKAIKAKLDEMGKIRTKLEKMQGEVRRDSVTSAQLGEGEAHLRKIDDADEIDLASQQNELYDRLESLQAEELAIRASQEKLRETISKQLNDYIKDKDLIGNETRNIAKERFYRVGKDQNTGAQRVYNSFSTEEFAQGLRETILRHDIDTGDKSIDKIVRQSMDNIKDSDITHLVNKTDAIELERAMNVEVANIRISNMSDADKKALGRIYGENKKGFIKALAIWNDLNRQLRADNIGTMQFGSNPANLRKLEGRKLRFALRSEEGIPDEAIAATLGDGEIRLVVDDGEASIGKQDSLLISNPTPEDMVIESNKLGINRNTGEVMYELPNGNKVAIGSRKEFNLTKNDKTGTYKIRIKTKDLTNLTDTFSYNMKDMYENNMRQLVYNRIGREANNRYVAELVESNILIPKWKAPSNYTDKLFSYDGVDYAVDKRFAHNIFGTRGKDITNKYVASLIKPLQGLRDIVKTKILNTRVKSYLNSVVANNITMKMTTDMSFTKIMEENDIAMKEINEFTSLAMGKGIRHAKSKQPLVYEFFYKVGGQDSIMRDAIRDNNKVAPNQFLEMAKGLSNSQLTHDIRETDLLDGSRGGDKLSSLFDATEIKQKFSFYKYQKRHGKSSQEAANELFEAFPTYAENLTDMGAMVDEAILFTKYMTNVPKIFRKALDKDTSGMIAMFLSMMALKEASYALMPEDPADGYMKEYGMSKIGPNSYANFSSMNNYNLSSMADMNLINFDTMMEHSTLLGADASVFSFGKEN